MSAYDALIAADRALFHWPLDDTGGTAADIIAHANDGALLHSPTTGVAGPVTGQAAMGFPNVYPAASPYVLLAHAALIPRPPAAFSLEAWVQSSDPFNPAYYWVLSTGTPGASDLSAQIQFLVNSADAADLWYYSNASGETANATPLFDGAWHHVVFTFDGAGISVWYLDGAAVALERDDGFSGPRPIATATPTEAVLAGNAANVGIGGDVGVGNLAGNLAHVAVYDYALSPCRVLSHYDLATTGTYTPCPDWVRVSHSSGHGYWQSRGDVTEQWAGGIRREVLPYPTMTPPATLVLGKDPATGLAMWVDPPAASSSIPVLPLPVGPSCTRACCGAAVTLQTKLLRDYDQWRQWINAAVNIAASGLIASVLDALLPILVAAEVAAWVLQVFQIVGPIIGSAGLTAIPGLIPTMSAPQVDALVHTFFCQLQCVGGTVSLGVADQQAVAGVILADHVTYPSDLQRELLGELVYYEPLQDWQAAMTNAAPSVLCDAMTCP